MKSWLTLSLALGGLCGAASAWSESVAQVGQPAPAFSAVDTRGQAVSLADFKGKYVVLEWVNPGCPFVQKHYDGGNLPATQKGATAKGVVWLAVNSTAKTASDYKEPQALDSWMRSKGAAPTATLMDADGKLGRAFGARTTPHLYVVDPQGKLIYAGAIDSKPSANPADIATATNYVNQALGEALAGQPVSRPVTQAYGCTVKYAG